MSAFVKDVYMLVILFLGASALLGAAYTASRNKTIVRRARIRQRADKYMQHRPEDHR